MHNFKFESDNIFEPKFIEIRYYLNYWHYYYYYYYYYFQQGRNIPISISQRWATEEFFRRCAGPDANGNAARKHAPSGFAYIAF